MICIYCGGKTSVVNSRGQRRSNQTWRRRQCQNCQAVFTSVEAVDLPSSLVFKRSPKHSERFQRDKLFVSVYESCKHRKDAAEASTALTATILGKLLHKIESATLDRVQVISVTTEVLRRFDKAAAVQYQAYHPID